MPPLKETVVVTGFGLFGSYEVNSSWVAVKELANLGLGIENMKLEIKEIPVEYEAIDKKVPQLFKKHKPILVVHVGVSGLAQTFELEQLAHNTGYNRIDMKEKCPKNYCCKDEGDEVLRSGIDMRAIAGSEEVKRAGVEANVSEDAGKYCCDYIYYSSLSMKQCPVMFIHVPPLNPQFDGKTLALGLRAIIQAVIRHINENQNS